ncbi:hypothetical protein Rsub_11334 [Raphidocelis subcapitata]|uniref:DUF5672 domain-containing protein n=1 Tax=Raphidocelis subcapitata TaxID=307507 RepID=A0A2V0PD74_9CHLO|nr:hypothetical protein Rsub_11334 [Raphidocelis subcapitata]|eukprot:GBF97808.1 hypothetical protein Rsub_11334 [Raphidocelis subcapitata]
MVNHDLPTMTPAAACPPQAPPPGAPRRAASHRLQRSSFVLVAALAALLLSVAALLAACPHNRSAGLLAAAPDPQQQLLLQASAAPNSSALCQRLGCGACPSSPPGGGAPADAAAAPAFAKQAAGAGKVAVLAETRASDRLVPVVVLFATRLPPDWRLQLFLSDEARAAAGAAPALRGWIESGRIIPLPWARAGNSTNVGVVVGEYNALLLSKAFWHAVAGEHVLIFQLDSALCAASPHKLDDFLEYDYVGAPWPESYGGPDHRPGCGNGGLSLRRRSAMLRSLERTGAPTNRNEDLVFCDGLSAIGGRLPTRETARTFAVEMMFYERPLGLHKFWQFFTPEQRRHLFDYCPEAMVAGGELRLPAPAQRGKA